MKKYLITILALIVFNTLHAQTYFTKENGKFTSNKISVLSVSPDKISIRVYYNSSAECACEENETFEIYMNDTGEYKYEIFENPENTIKIYQTESKVKLIEVVNNEDYNCCSIISGEYYLKP